MGLIHLALIVAACLHSSSIQPGLCSEKPASHPFVQQPFIRKHFLGRRIPYSLNCNASFQLEPLQAGDVNPNPGPDRQVPRTLLTTTGSDNIHLHRAPVEHGARYTPTELLQWKD